MKRSFISALLMFFCTILYAFPDTEKSRSLLQKINKDLQQEWENNRKTREALEKFIEWLQNVFDWSDKNSRIFIIAAICVLVLILSIAAFLIIRRLRGRAKKIHNKKTEPTTEDDILPSTNILSAASEAAEAGSYSEAIILLYLDSLRYFDIKNHASLTNSDLLQKIDNAQMRQSFGALAFQEEKITFAAIPANESDYLEAKSCADKLRMAATL